MKDVSLKLTIAMHYASQGVFLPFLPILLKNHAFSYSQIGTLLAAGAVVGVLTQSLWGYLCDRLQTVKKLLLLQLVASVILSMYIFEINTFANLLVYLTVFYVFFRPLPTMFDTLIIQTISANPARYGHYRMFGSIGFLLTALFSGYFLNWFGLSKGPYLITGLIGLSLLCAVFIQDTNYACQTPRFKDFSELIKQPAILQFLLAATFLGTTHVANDNFISVHLQALGGSLKDTGLLWTVGVTTEILTFAVLSQLNLQGKSLYFLRLVALLYGLRWLLMAFITDVKVVLLIQVLHGICYSLFITMIQQYLVVIIPNQLRATGQGLMYMTVFGLGGVIGMIGGGQLMERFGSSNFYLSCLCFALVSFFTFQRLDKDRV
ncbi:MFS transporter [Desulfosporosinus sp. HMP52]|uniref:MFS transporter n=1 Tax=Desulfosporosinus sp. HMP52 TaxID=1487923 RepID=UPI00051FE713|nr:MFS transporter [Desulfosporosinus sp. HMP52]KGK82398.1 MFS transporter [Desulfosporosinus sp. HMP52]